MAKSGARLAAADIASIVVAGSFAMLAANLTLVVAFTDSDLITDVLLKPMWLGLHSAYVLTGGSDGSARRQEAAPYLAAWINAAVYAGVVLMMRLIWRQLMLNPTKETKRPALEEEIR